MATSPAYQKAFSEGRAAVHQKPQQAPRNPYDEDTQPVEHQGWEDGAIEAGVTEIYTNGVLDAAY